MKLGQKVKAARERRGWGMAELARRSGVELRTIHAIETRNSTRSNFASAIAKALGVPVDAILSDDDSAGVPAVEQQAAHFDLPDSDRGVSLSEQEHELVLAFRDLPSAQQTELLEQLLADAKKWRAYAEEVLARNGAKGTAPNLAVALAYGRPPPVAPAKKKAKT